MQGQTQKIGDHHVLTKGKYRSCIGLVLLESKRGTEWDATAIECANIEGPENKEKETDGARAQSRRDEGDSAGRHLDNEVEIQHGLLSVV